MTSISDRISISAVIIPSLISGTFILVGLVTFFTSDNIFDLGFSVFFCFLGLLILLYPFREFKSRQRGESVIKHDERSKENKFKATDLSFRFLTVFILILILLNAFDLVNDTIFVALTGPIVAMGITLNYLSYYWYERRG